MKLHKLIKKYIYNHKAGFILLLALCCYSKTYGQIPSQIVNLPGTNFVYVGSLTDPDFSAGNSQKIIVKIFGGSWFSESNGETTYYISNRAGLTAKQVSVGNQSSRWFSLKMYQNGSKVDLYVVPNPVEYTSFAVTSFTFGSGINAQFVNITNQNSQPVGTDITASAEVTPLMATDGMGNVALGTTDTKGYKLAVAGNMIAESVKVQLKGSWADYVFEDDYKLKTLEETEAFVKKNKHLPEIPSAAEVKNNGIDLGEMNVRLLQKIEELTLHLIEKEKKDNDQQKQIDLLKVQVDKLLKSNKKSK